MPTAGKQTAAVVADRREKTVVLDRLTQRISNRLRQEIEQELRQEGATRTCSQQDAEAGVERLLAGEIRSQTCAICMELLLAPKRAPIMLFPCGHTFCKSCVSHVRKTASANGGAKCPYCRTKIESEAPNITLQQLVQTYAAQQDGIDAGAYDQVTAACGNQTVPNESSSGVATQVASEVERYSREWRLCDMRCRILGNERAEALLEAEAMTGKHAAAELVLARLTDEETRIKARMAALAAELELTAKHRSEQQAKLSSVEAARKAAVERVELLDAALEPVGRDRDKYALLLEGFGMTPSE